MKIYFQNSHLCSSENISLLPNSYRLNNNENLPRSIQSSYRKIRTEFFSLHPDLINVDLIFPHESIKMTERYLQTISLQELMVKWEQYLNMTGSEIGKDTKEDLVLLRDAFEEEILFLLNLASTEDKTVFGYHGAAQDYRIFQDALKVIFEELLMIQLPDDFHFLRIPGDEFKYGDADIKKSFFERKDLPLPKELYPYIIDFFILEPISQKYEKSLTSIDFSEAAKEELSLLLKCIREKINRQGNNDGALFPNVPNLIQEIACHAEISNSQIQDILLEWITNCSNLPSEFNDFLMEKFWNQKELPWKVRRELLRNLQDQWTQFICPFLDGFNKGAKEVFSMVGPLFSGLENPHMSSCIYPFIFNDGYTIDQNNILLLELKQFCANLSLEPTLAEQLINCGMDIVRKTGNQRGVIYQLYDTSAQHLNGVDSISYLSQNYGFPILDAENLALSSFVDGSLVYSNDEQIQIRLILENGTALNPYSFIRMTRYDTLPEGTDSAIYSAMREILLKSPSADPMKVEQYKEKLRSYWQDAAST